MLPIVIVLALTEPLNVVVVSTLSSFAPILTAVNAVVAPISPEKVFVLPSSPSISKVVVSVAEPSIVPATVMSALVAISTVKVIVSAVLPPLPKVVAPTVIAVPVNSTNTDCPSVSPTVIVSIAALPAPPTTPPKVVTLSDVSVPDDLNVKFVVSSESKATILSIGDKSWA